MDPDAVMIVALALIFFAFISMMVRSKHKHELAKLDRIAQGNADRSLTTGELENMIREVVSDMTEPLKERLDELSEQIDPSSSRPLLDSESMPADESLEQKTVGRRTRA